ncbi:MAG: extracellular solute-binding protein [Beutenbergiaceae bacterium]
MTRSLRTRSVAAVTMGALGLATVSACTVSSTDPSDGESVRVIAQAGGPGEALQAAAESYNEQGLGATIEVSLFDYDAVRERTVLGFNSGNESYDVIGFDYAWMPEYVENDYLLSLNDHIGEAGDDANMDDFVSAYVDWATIDEQQYAIPWFGAVYMLYYRESLLQEAGVSVPTTWEEYAAAAKAVQDTTGVTGTTLIGKRDDPLMCEFWSIAWSYGADIVDGETVTLDTPEAAQALELWQSILPNAPQDALSADWPAAAAAFAEGKTAMMINFSDTSDALLTSDVQDDIGFAALPAGPTGDSTPNLGGWGLGVSTGSQNQDAAFDFIIWATSAEQQTAGLDNGGSANRTSVLSDPELQERFPYFAAALENYNNSVYFPVTSAWIDWEAAISPPLSEAMSGTISVEDGLTQAATRLTDEIAEG